MPSKRHGGGGGGVRTEILITPREVPRSERQERERGKGLIVMVMSTTGMTMAGTSRGVVSGRRRSGGALPRSAAGGQRRPFRTRAPLRESTTNVASRRRTRDPTVAVAGSVGPSKTERGDGNEFAIELDNASNPEFTVVTVDIADKPGLLTLLSSTFHDMNLSVEKAEYVQGAGIKFWIKDEEDRKIEDAEDGENIKQYLSIVLSKLMSSPSKPRPFAQAYAEAPQPDHLNRELLYGLLDSYLKNDVVSIQESIVHHVEFTLARSRYKFDTREAYFAAAHSLRDRLIERWNDTQAWIKHKDPKRVYYLSMEFLMGRTFLNALHNLGVMQPYQHALSGLGYDMEKVQQAERDAALGNGGLGRLASCFLDSMATLNLPAWGYGIRYEYGMFRQVVSEGFQKEQPDYWLTFGYPWEIERPHVAYPVKFYGHVSVHESQDGRQNFVWNAGEEVTAVAYDNPIPGFKTPSTINLRLWAAKPCQEFDLEAFNTGDYVSSIIDKQKAETITSVLYPDDKTFEGKELRLKQQHFMVSATLQDIVRRYKEQHETFDAFPEKVAMQLNDTHPTLGIPELMRILMDENHLGWTRSWEITTKVFSFTNHTVLPEALEQWPVSLVEKLLPRHMQIIYDINWRFLQELQQNHGISGDKLGSMSIILDTEYGKMVRMAYLALVASHTVNGVAAIHSKLIKETIFKEFHDIWPEKFQNKTNGVTQRRWLAQCNPPLNRLITETLGTEAWITHLDLLKGLAAHAEDETFQQKWAEVKVEAKAKLASLLKDLTGDDLNMDAIFDVQVKRIHEYKRQFMNILSVALRYDRIKSMTEKEKEEVVPRVVIIGGKAAPGYDMAKRIIKLISAVSETVNNDPDVGDLLKVYFVPDYNVSLAEVIVPGSDLNQQISTAGTEASGTSNMKFAMNGSLIIGTMDGANVEIAEEIGEENMFIFGVGAQEVPALRSQREYLQVDPQFQHAVNLIQNGHFGWADYFSPLIESITGSRDWYLLANDFESYLDAQERVDQEWRDKASWTRKSILSTAGSGKFSSDRTIHEYAEDIWGVEPLPPTIPE